MSTIGYVQYIAALIFVIGLVIAAGWVARRFGLGGAMATPLGRRRRLQMIEVLPVDARRRLVLVRRDDVEHLLLIGPNDALLVERGIGTERFTLPADRDSALDAAAAPSPEDSTP